MYHYAYEPKSVGFYTEIWKSKCLNTFDSRVECLNKPPHQTQQTLKSLLAQPCWPKMHLEVFFFKIPKPKNQKPQNPFQIQIIF